MAWPIRSGTALPGRTVRSTDNGRFPVIGWREDVWQQRVSGRRSPSDEAHCIFFTFFTGIR